MESPASEQQPWPAGPVPHWESSNPRDAVRCSRSWTVVSATKRVGHYTSGARARMCGLLCRVSNFFFFFFFFMYPGSRHDKAHAAVAAVTVGWLQGALSRRTSPKRS